MIKFISVRNLRVQFIESLKFVAGGRKSLSRKIHSGKVVQPGYELSGYMFPEQIGHVYVFGEREKTYVTNKLSTEDFESYLKEFMSLNPPCLIFSRKFKCPNIVIEMANSHNIAVFQTINKNEQDFTYHLTNFLSETFAPTIEKHASCLSIFGCGVLIEGASGIGKSESTLDLLKRGHMFVCDDRVILKRVGSTIFASAPEITKHLLEVRGIGIIDIKRMFGLQSCIDGVPLKVITKLVDWEKTTTIDRIGDKVNIERILDLPIPYYEIPVTLGRNISELIETSVVGYLLKKDGMSPATTINNRIKIAQKQQTENES